MNTAMDERIRRVVLGVIMIVAGYTFVWPLQFLSFFSGLMLFGFAVDPRGTEFPEDEPQPARMAPKMAAMAESSEEKPVEKPAAPKRSSRKKKAS